MLIILNGVSTSKDGLFDGCLLFKCWFRLLIEIALVCRGLFVVFFGQRKSMRVLNWIRVGKIVLELADGDACLYVFC